MSVVRAVWLMPPIVLGVTLAMSCGGAPSAPQAPATESWPATPVSPPKPDLSAVSAPAALVVSGHLFKPGASLSTVHGWSNLPAPQSEEVTELVMGEVAGPLVDLDQPIDFAVAVVGTGTHTRDRSCVSAALKDVEHAKASLAERYKLVPGEGGVLLIQPQVAAASRDDDDDSARRACEIAPAYGAAPVRLVCGWNAKALSELGPWLTRTATRTEMVPDVDLRVDLRMQPLHAALTGQKRLMATVLASVLGARFELSSARLLASSVLGDVVDFALDLDSASVDVKLGPPMAAATATLRFSGRTSALARLATAHPDRGAPAPGAFWRLPGDADFAFFERGIDDAEIARGRELALRVIGDQLAEFGVKDADRKAIFDAVDKLASSAPIAYASGLDSEAAKKALAIEKSLSGGSDPTALADARRASAEALLGWRVIALDETSGKWMDAMKELASAWSRPGVAAAYRAKANGAPAPAFHALPMSKGMTLPASAQHYGFDLYPFDAPVAGGATTGSSVAKAKTPRKAFTIHVFLVPDGNRLWVGIGADAVVASKLAASIGSAGDALSAVPELKAAPALQAADLGAGGFATVRGLAELPEQVAALLGGPGNRAEGLEEMARLPHHGAAPIAFALTARADAAAPQVLANVSMSRAAIEDIVAAIQRYGH